MKKKKRLIMSCLLALLCTGMAQADADTWVYVANSSGDITANGVAAYSSSNEYTMQFDSEGNAVITYGTGSTAVNVAKLLEEEVASGYDLVATLSAPSGTTGSITKTIGAGGYATFFSPFAVTIPSGVTAYAPTYASNKQSLLLNSSTLITSGTFVPARTGLVLKGASSATITFADGTGTADTHTTCLFGSAIGAATPTPNANNYVFGINSGATGFTKYEGTTLALTEAYYLNNSATPVTGDGMAFIDSEGEITENNFYAYIEKTSNGTSSIASENGVATFDSSNEYTLKYDTDGNAVITYGTVNVAKLLSSEIEANASLVATYTAPSGVTPGSITKTIGAGGYATIYSPFAINIPIGVTVYAPTYAIAKASLLLNSSTQVSGFVPAGTGIILKGTAGSVTISFADGTGTADTHTSCLFGSAIGAATPTPNANNYVFGINSGATGFTKYTEANLAYTEAYYLNNNTVNPVTGDDMAFVDSEGEVTIGNFFAYVQQAISNVTSVVTADGVNTYDVSDGTTSYTLCFDTDDNAVIMNSANQVIASLPVNSDTNGELVVSATNDSGIDKLGYIKMTFDSYGYKTLCSPFNITAPSQSEVKIFAPTIVENKYLDLSTPIDKDGVIPASTGLMLDTSKEAKTVSLLFSNSASTASVENNILKGVTLDTNVESTSLVLGKSGSSSDFGFFKIKGKTSGSTTVYTVTASKAYIENGTQYAKGLTFIYDDPTGIEEIEEGKGSEEIEETPANGAYYNLAGQRVGSNARGIVIHNGKKILINK